MNKESVLVVVPTTASRLTLLKEVLDFSERKKDDIDYFIFHQANEFILNYLSKKMKLSKIPSLITILFDP